MAYFPQGVATGNAFLSRDVEAKMLNFHIQSGHHTLLMAPRRFGKTSLARRVLAKMDLPSVEANFFLCKSEQSVQRKILAAVQDALSKIKDKPDTVVAKLRDYLVQSKKTWKFGISGLASVEIMPDVREEPAEIIFTAFNILEKILKGYEQKLVLFFDEIQEIERINNGRALQGAIREFAQESEHVVFIFSGSNRRLLHAMFDDQSMPLYELCDRIQLKKIEPVIYQKYIQKIAKQTRSEKLDQTAIDKILSLSDRHPKRVYNLCFQIWGLAPKTITEKMVEKAWNIFIESRVSDVRFRLGHLSLGQLKVLTLIASEFDKPLTGREAQTELSLSGSSIIAALQVLEDEAYLERAENNQWKIIDPLFKDVLRKYEVSVYA